MNLNYFNYFHVLICLKKILLGQNNENNSLFTYDNGTSWSSYVDTNFMPIFFNANLTIMFPNADDRKTAQDVCYKVNETDPDPTQRRLCYYDLKATGQISLAQGTSNAKAEVDNTQNALGNYYF